MNVQALCPFLIRIAQSQGTFDFFVFNDAALFGIDHEHLARLQTPFLFNLTLRNRQCSCFRSQDHNIVVGQNIATRTKTVSVEYGTDAHTVGIDAIMNRKGFAGHYGLERYDMIEAINMGAQVPNEEFIKKAVEVNADVLLVSQTVTQKDIHIQNLTELIELLEAEGLRDRFIVCCGGARITHELAKELGFDAGFGASKYADDVATFAVTEMVKRGMK